MCTYKCMLARKMHNNKKLRSRTTLTPNVSHINIIPRTQSMTIAVRGSNHRQGIASKLLETCGETFDPTGGKPCRCVELHCLTTNRAAIALYKKCGFRIMRTIQSHYYFDQQFHDAYLLRRDYCNRDIQKHTGRSSSTDSSKKKKEGGGGFSSLLRDLIQGAQKIVARVLSPGARVRAETPPCPMGGAV